MLGLSQKPRVEVFYVSCNPVTFARDARILIDRGYHPTATSPGSVRPIERSMTQPGQPGSTFNRPATTNPAAQAGGGFFRPGTMLGGLAAGLAGVPAVVNALRYATFTDRRKAASGSHGAPAVKPICGSSDHGMGRWETDREQRGDREGRATEPQS